MSGRSTRPSSDPNRPRSGTWRHVVVALVLALVSVLGIGPAVAQPQPGADQAPPVINPQARAADLVQPAVVFVRIHFDAWVLTDLFGGYKVPLDYSCSGFIVNPDGYIVTAGHCVQDDMEGAQGDAVTQVVDQLVQEGRVSFFERDQLIEDVLVGNREWQVEGQLDGSKPDRKVSVVVGGGKVKFGKVNSNGTRPARVIEEPTKDHGDVALLKVNRKGLPSVLLSPPDNDIQVGEELLSIGYPAPEDSDESFGLTNRNGQVNAEITKGSNNQTYYETSTSLSHGQSGGPGINNNGQVIGLASLKSEDANYLVPASIIREMLNRNSVRNELGQLDQLYRQGLENLYRGAYSAAIKDFDQVLALMPGHRLAQAKKTQAAERREKFGDPPPPVPPDKPGPSTNVLLGGAAAVLVVLGATTALVLRRRSGRHHRRRRARAPQPFTGNPGWDANTFPPAAQAQAPEESAGAMTGHEELDDSDVPQIAHAEPSSREPYPTRSEALHDPGSGDGSVRDGARAATSVSVWDPEAATGSQPAAEPARAARSFCSNCGNRVRPDDLYCLGCGARLD
jgi:serine protease Do